MIWQEGSTVEMRVPNTHAGTVSGYYDDLENFARDAAYWDGKAPGVYFTLNPVNPALLARAANRWKGRVKHTTSDPDIIRRVWLPLDFDATRPAGVSSTDTEHEAAIQRARDCANWLVSRDVAPQSIVLADSGNGAHVLVRIDLPNDARSLELVSRLIESVAFRFSDAAVTVDLGVSNAARIWKVYGTAACKGDNFPQRPHRRARILQAPS